MQPNINRLREILTHQIIPYISSNNSLRMILAKRPLQPLEGVTLRRHPAPALVPVPRCSNRSDLFLGKYPEEGIHATRCPYLCYVFEGEIDMRLGIPVKQNKARSRINFYDILTLPTHSALLIPPGVFYPEGKHLHWERPLPALDAHIFWVHILPTGIFCHVSNRHHSVHTSENLDVFIPGHQFAQLIEMFEDELSLPGADAQQVAHHALLLFFSRLKRGLTESANASKELTQSPLSDESTSQNSQSIVIQRAFEFIRKHNGTSFAMEEVASYAYVSPSHLMRLFRNELGTTVMEYTLQQRMETAKSWLVNSDIPIKQIAASLSYRQTPQFTRVFLKHFGMTPTQFRRVNRNGK